MIYQGTHTFQGVQDFTNATVEGLGGGSSPSIYATSPENINTEGQSLFMAKGTTSDIEIVVADPDGNTITTTLEVSLGTTSVTSTTDNKFTTTITAPGSAPFPANTLTVTADNGSATTEKVFGLYFY